jgi:hypothetical protein
MAVRRIPKPEALNQPPFVQIKFRLIQKLTYLSDRLTYLSETNKFVM